MSLRQQDPAYTRLGYSILDVPPLKLYDRLIIILALLPEHFRRYPDEATLHCSRGKQNAQADITHGVHVIQVTYPSPMGAVPVVISRIIAAIADLIVSPPRLAVLSEPAFPNYHPMSWGLQSHQPATAKPRLPPPNARMDMVSAQIDRVTDQNQSLYIEPARTVPLVYDIQLADSYVASRYRDRVLIHREKPRPADYCTGTDD
ncbi:hypothetical protein COCC4DRAFT_23370 [Bipolaris maydis ATCC 48331]|uniref:Uncharacterized protein n=1 Tax=Cochliobolus heterostrophus (strain C4 / ATCC 48331 / race T) TaxID=665024 RepID=N4X1R7_COCH4|nr:uncharacterized protein COCC4DRAFT_23370 [Bipolaris maydis ATCC 48331]ENI05630.1 hypothetical protein COCC4DRAFT_23370 [Bipolaris maydis ATCC 48331]